MGPPQGYCLWVNMEDDLKASLRDCSFCVDYQTAWLAPRQLAHTVHGMKLDAGMTFDLLYIFECEMPIV